MTDQKALEKVFHRLNTDLGIVQTLRESGIKSLFVQARTAVGTSGSNTN